MSQFCWNWYYIYKRTVNAVNMGEKPINMWEGLKSLKTKWELNSSRSLFGRFELLTSNKTDAAPTSLQGRLLLAWLSNSLMDCRESRLVHWHALFAALKSIILSLELKHHLLVSPDMVSVCVRARGRVFVVAQGKSLIRYIWCAFVRGIFVQKKMYKYQIIERYAEIHGGD